MRSKRLFLGDSAADLQDSLTGLPGFGVSSPGVIDTGTAVPSTTAPGVSIPADEYVLGDIPTPTPSVTSQVTTAAGTVLTSVENFGSSLWGTVTALPTAATQIVTWTPYVLAAAALLAVYLFVPKGGSYTLGKAKR
jgi:hypothetical protein